MGTIKNRSGDGIWRKQSKTKPLRFHSATSCCQIWIVCLLLFTVRILTPSTYIKNIHVIRQTVCLATLLFTMVFLHCMAYSKASVSSGGDLIAQCIRSVRNSQVFVDLEYTWPMTLFSFVLICFIIFLW